MYIKVRSIPNSKKEYIKELKEDTYEIAVREPAEKNLANRKIIEVLAEHLGRKTNVLRIIAGHHHTSKIIELIEK